MNSIKNGFNLKLELLPVKERQKICSKSINDDGTYRINNYTKIKKVELIEKMNAIYDMLKFDQFLFFVVNMIKQIILICLVYYGMMKTMKIIKIN